MSRFYGTMTGQARTAVTRQGGQNSGVHAHVRGWNIGIRTTAFDSNGNDAIVVSLTTGSSGRGPNKELLVVELVDGEAVIKYTDRR